MSKSCLGLDIGSNYIKLVELRGGKRGPFQVLFANKIPTPDNSIDKSKILDETLLANALGRLLTSSSIKTNRVVLGLNSSHTMLKTVTFPKMPHKELERMLDFEINELFNFPEGQDAKDFSYSFEILNEAKNEMDLLIVACPLDMINSYLNVLRQVDLVPFIIDVGAFTLPRVSESNLRSCYVDLGHSQTIIYIEINGVYKVHRILPIGGINISQGIMEAFATLESNANHLKVNQDIDYLMLEGTGSKGLLRTIMQQYVAGILQTLDYLRSQYRSSSITEVLDQVILCGGNAHIKGIDGLFQQELGVDVVVLDPFTRLTTNLSIPKDRSIYSTAIGLGLRGLEEP